LILNTVQRLWGSEKTIESQGSWKNSF